MRYVIGFIIFVVLIFIGVKLIFGGSKKAPKPVTTTVVKTLPDYASTDAEVRFTIDGPVVGDDLHREIQITIGRHERTLDIIQGYQNLVVNTKTYDNNQAAYDVFLRSINYLNFTKGRKVKTTDERGVCPLGNRYIYELINTGSSDEDKRLWSTSCNTSYGTFAGVPVTIRSLFQKQITDYQSLTAGVVL